MSLLVEGDFCKCGVNAIFDKVVSGELRLDALAGRIRCKCVSKMRCHTMACNRLYRKHDIQLSLDSIYTFLSQRFDDIKTESGENLLLEGFYLALELTRIYPHGWIEAFPDDVFRKLKLTKFLDSHIASHQNCLFSHKSLELIYIRATNTSVVRKLLPSSDVPSIQRGVDVWWYRSYLNGKRASFDCKGRIYRSYKKAVIRILMHRGLPRELCDIIFKMMVF